MSNNNTLTKKNQDCIEKLFPDLSFFITLHSTKRELLNILFYLDRKYKGVIFISQRKLAALLGITREWANKLIGYLADHKILFIEQNRNRSNYYTLSERFRSFDFCKSLSKTFKNLYLPALFLSFSEVAPIAVFQREFTHTNVNYLFKIRKRNTYSHSTKKIGESTMKYEFSKALHELKSISLTEAGMAILSAFPDEALRNTDSEIKSIKNLRNPFGFFYARCKKYCTEKNLFPDWDLQRTLAHQYEIRAETPMLLENKPQQQERKQPALEWVQPETKRYGYMKMRIPFNPNETQATANYRAMLRANNALIEDDEPMPHKGIWPLISRQETDKSYEEFMKTGKIPENIFRAARFVNHPIAQKPVNDEPPLTDYSLYEEDYADLVLEL